MNNPNQLIKFLFPILFFMAVISWTGEIFWAKVVRVIDDDTILVALQKKQIKVNFYGIDTPRKEQAFGEKAKQFISHRVLTKTVAVMPMDSIQNGSTEALVWPPDEKETINETLVKSGFARVYGKHCKARFCRDWLALEEDAKSTKTGLWTDNDQVPLSDFKSNQ